MSKLSEQYLKEFSALLNEGISHEDLADTLHSRLQFRYPDVIDKYGYDAVENAVNDVASFHAGAEELGTSDVSIMLKEIIKSLESRGVAESLSVTQKKIEDTIVKLEQRLKFAKTPEQWDNIKNRIERLQAGLNRSKQGVAEGFFDRFKRKPAEPEDPRMMQSFDAAGGYKRKLDVMAWQMGWKLSKKHPGASASEAFEKLYYGGGSPFPFDEKTFKMAWNAAQEQGVAEASFMDPSNPISPISPMNPLHPANPINVMRMTGPSGADAALAHNIGYAIGMLGVLIGLNADSIAERAKKIFKSPGTTNLLELEKCQKQIAELHKKTKTLKSERGVQKARDELKLAYEELERIKAKIASGVVSNPYSSVNEAYKQSPEELKQIAQGVAEEESKPIANTAKRLADKKDGAIAKHRAARDFDRQKKQERAYGQPRMAETTGDAKFDTMFSKITAPAAVKAQSREDKVNELIRQYFWHKRRADLGPEKTDEYGHDKLTSKILLQLNKMGVDLSKLDPVKLRNIKSQVYEQSVDTNESSSLTGEILPFPEIVNKINSTMRVMGWKGSRKDDGTFMFATKGYETEDQFYIVLIDNAGKGYFNYALGTVEEGEPHIGEENALPNTEASISELMDSIREGFGLNESVTEDSDPCWKDYKQIGMKMKNGNKVPNCVSKESTINEAAGNEIIRSLIKEFNIQMSGSPYYPLDYKSPGIRVFTRGDGSRYKDPGYIFIDRDLKPEDIPKWRKSGAVEKFWQFLAQKGARKIGDVSGEFGSSPHSPAVVLSKLIFVFDGHSIAWGSTSRLKNSNVWRQKQAVAEEQVNELSTEKLAQYKTAASKDASAADKAGDFKRGDKRFSGIVKATIKQFDNDAKQVKESSIMKGLKNVK